MTSSSRLAGRIAFVTGGGTGIGRAIAERFSAEGALAVVAGRRADVLAQAAAAIRNAGGRAETEVLDMRDLDAVDAVIDRVGSRHGRIDILVNNAGISAPTPVGKVTRAEWRDILATNLDGAFFAAIAALRHMKDHSGARILNIATIGAHMPFPGWTAYCASKAGLVGVTKCLAMELAPRGITVNAILPGWVKSDMSDTGVKAIAKDMGLSPEEALPNILAAVPLKRMSDAAEVAALAVHICSEDGRGMTGSSTVISNGALMN